MTGRRPDGRHLLDSLVAFVALHDRLTLRAAPATALARTGPHAAALAGETDDLALRAVRVLAAAAGRSDGVAIGLEKNIPVAAGLGGGSADAAATLRGLCRLWRLDPARPDLPALALRLGADVPVCLAGRAAVVGGIGERIGPPVPLPPADLVLVRPPVRVSTAAVFARHAAGAVAPPPPAGIAAPLRDVHGLAAMLALRRNDLTDAATATAPAIAAVLSALAADPDCLLARMTGSGATCFGLFASAPQAAGAAARLARARPDWWIRKTALANDAAASGAASRAVPISGGGRETPAARS